jgi:endonuclease/exonuclease/phosphatase family metal-dependent hydrolase
VSRFPIVSAGEWADVEVSNRDFAWAIIDVPGDIDLQVVSVHLTGGSASGEASTRNDQALAIRANVLSSFDPDHYIVVGGTMNVHSASEAAICRS